MYMNVLHALTITSLNWTGSCFNSQGLDEEALVDYGKTSFTTQTNYEKEDLESKLFFFFVFFSSI